MRMQNIKEFNPSDGRGRYFDADSDLSITAVKLLV